MLYRLCLILEIHPHNLSCSASALHVCPVINMAKYSSVCVSVCVCVTRRRRRALACIYMCVYVTVCARKSLEICLGSSAAQMGLTNVHLGHCKFTGV